MLYGNNNEDNKKNRKKLVYISHARCRIMDGQKPPGGADHPEKAEYKYPTRNCTDTQFC